MLRMWEKKSSSLPVGMEISSTTTESSLEVTQKSTNRPTIDPATPVLGSKWNMKINFEKWTLDCDSFPIGIIVTNH
jgi:hypothetical protein